MTICNLAATNEIQRRASEDDVRDSEWNQGAEAVCLGKEYEENGNHSQLRDIEVTSGNKHSRK